MASSRRERRDAVIQNFVVAARVFGIALVLAIGFFELGNYFQWFHLQALVASLTWAVVVLTAVDSAWGLARVKRREGQLKQAQRIRKTLTGVALDVSRETEIRVESIGVTLWLVEKPGKVHRTIARARGHEAKPDRLVRAETVRLSGFPVPTHYEWTKGRGVIGQCWKHAGNCYRDFSSLQASYPADTPLTDKTWKTAKPSAMGFKRGEFLKFIHKYQQILAVPMTDREGHFLGCISIDLPTERRSDNSLNKTEVQVHAAQACETLRDLDV